MNVSKSKKIYIRWLLVVFLPLLLFALWSFALPNVVVHYSKAGKEEFSYVWNVQNRIYRGRMPPGGGTSDNGFIFPDDKFFMEFDWWTKQGRSQCVSIIPRWPRTDVYLDADGNIDWDKESGTDVDRLKECPRGHGN